MYSLNPTLTPKTEILNPKSFPGLSLCMVPNTGYLGYIEGRWGGLGTRNTEIQVPFGQQMQGERLPALSGSVHGPFQSTK